VIGVGFLTYIIGPI